MIIKINLMFTNGLVDEDASFAVAKEAIQAYKLEQEKGLKEIAETMMAIFEQYKKAAVNVPFLTSEVCRRLGVSPGNFKEITEKVEMFLKNNSQGKTLEDGSVEHPNSLYVITRGKSGGVRLRSDIVASTQSETELQNAEKAFYDLRLQ